MKKFAKLPLLIIGILMAVTIKTNGQKQFEVVSRRSADVLSQGSAGLGTANGQGMSGYRLKKSADREPEYAVKAKGAEVAIDALSYVQYAAKADRIVTYGDSLDKHVVSRMFFKMYNGSGTLIKSSDEIVSFPFTAALAEDGSFYVAGNQGGGKEKIVFIKFDKNGNKQWEVATPSYAPVQIYPSGTQDRLALVAYDEKQRKSVVLYYTAEGTLLNTDHSFTNVSGVEFLPNGLAVITTGREWYLTDYATNKYKNFGSLSANTIGSYPIASHPSTNYFTIVTIAHAGSGSGFSLQAHSNETGELIAKGNFEGIPYWQPYPLAKVLDDGSIELIADKEILQLRIKR